VALAHRNLMAVNARMAEGPRTLVRSEDGSLLVAPRSELPFLNTVMREPTAGRATPISAASRRWCAAARGPLPEAQADLREVESIEEGEAYWGICDAAYVSLGLPAGVLPQAFRPESVLGSDSVAAWLAPADGPPTACASVVLAEQVGMVAWVGVLPEARGRGLASACTVRATNEAFARGAELVSLQASAMGESLYRRVGYEELYNYRLLGAMPD